MKSAVIEMIWLCVPLPSSRNEVTKVQVSSFSLEHGLVSGKRRRVGFAPRKAPQPLGQNWGAMTSPRLPLYRKKGGDVCQIAVRFDLTLLRRSQMNLRRWRACRSGAGAGFLSTSHRVFDLGTMHAYFSDMCQTADWWGTLTQVEVKKEKKKKKKKVPTTSKQPQHAIWCLIF